MIEARTHTIHVEGIKEETLCCMFNILSRLLITWDHNPTTHILTYTASETQRKEIEQQLQEHAPPKIISPVMLIQA